MKVGMIGAGSIAGVMAGTIKEMDCAQNYAVAARDLSLIHISEPTRRS